MKEGASRSSHHFLFSCVIVFAIELNGTLFLHYSLTHCRIRTLKSLCYNVTGLENFHKACVTVWALRHHDLLEPLLKLFTLELLQWGGFFHTGTKLRWLFQSGDFKVRERS
jgi:hypothetical protein